MKFLSCFIVGGIFCVIAQILIDKTKLTPARILVGYVCAGVVLSAIGVYPYLVDFAGCGATVPLTGFGHSLAQGVKEAVTNEGLIGAFSGGFRSVSAGICSAIVFSFLFALIFNGKPENL